MSHRIGANAMKIANKNAREFVVKQHPFQGSNIFAQFHTVNNEDGTNGPGTWYAVYSFGDHWPLFIHADGIWFENEDKFSRTTAKHRTQTHPHCSTVLLSGWWMKRLAKGGYVAIAKERILTGGTA